MRSTEFRNKYAGRFSYLKVFKAEENERGVLTFSTAFLFPKMVDIDGERVKNPDIPRLRKAVQAAFEAGGKEKFGKMTIEDIKTPLRDGDEEVRKGKKGDEYAGFWFLNASSQNKPGIVDADLDEIMERNVFYSGCWGRIHLNFYPYNTKGSQGVAAGLENVQMLREGDRLGGSGTAAKVAFAFDDDDDMMG